MCRGCDMIQKNGANMMREYLDWLDGYHKILKEMKDLHGKILDFEDWMKHRDQKKVISRFRRRLIGLRKGYAKADLILNQIEEI